MARNPYSEENIPLHSTLYDGEQAQQKRKGKERAVDNEIGSPIFDVGEDEEDYSDHDQRK